MGIFMLILRLILGGLVLVGFFMSLAHSWNSLGDKDWKQLGIGLVLVAFFVLIMVNFP